jgi:inosine-uridine nucleoside N-ribohydrolase
VKLLLDTDIGSDIDDAVCLAYLLAQPACDLLGITTVTGEAVARARMASAMCRLAGRDVPIYPGAERPLLAPQRQPAATQAAALAEWPHESGFPENEAVTFLRDAIRAAPGEVTLLAIGPLTNVALLFATYPDTPGLLKELMLMCGAFGTGSAPVTHAEWNARVDPHAAAIVYGTHGTRPVRRSPGEAVRPTVAPLSVGVHRSVGLDVTLQVQLSRDEAQRRFDHPLLRPVRDFAAIWFKERDRITFHDPLAAVALFDPAVAGFERGEVTVDLGEADELGRTGWRADAAGPHEVASRVDPAAFFDRYFSVFR